MSQTLEMTVNEAKRINQLVKDITLGSQDKSMTELDALESCADTLLKNIRSLLRAKKSMAQYIEQ